MNSEANMPRDERLDTDASRSVHLKFSSPSTAHIASVYSTGYGADTASKRAMFGHDCMCKLSHVYRPVHDTGMYLDCEAVLDIDDELFSG